MRDLVTLFKALADQTRLEMLLVLQDRPELCVCDVMESLGISQSKASRHLTTLRQAGLVDYRREGQWSYYARVEQDDPSVRALMAAVDALLRSHPRAAEVIEGLEGWLDGGTRASICGKGRPCTSGPRTAPATIEER